MLFITWPTISIRSVPMAIGVNGYSQPSDWICSLPITYISAVAQPGGCIVRVKCMNKTESETLARITVQFLICHQNF